MSCSPVLRAADRAGIIVPCLLLARLLSSGMALGFETDNGPATAKVNRQATTALEDQACAHLSLHGRSNVKAKHYARALLRECA